MAVINQNQQLRGRFLAPIHMPRFDWANDDAQGEFIACLESFQLGLKRYQFPNLTSDEMAFRFYCATGGLIGYLAKILHQACLNAQVDNKLSICLEDLARAYEESVWVDTLLIENPFSKHFNTDPDFASLNAARQIGTASYEEFEPRLKRSKSKITAAEALTQ